MCMAMPELETECAGIEAQIEDVAARLQQAEREIEAARDVANSGVSMPGGHGAAIQKIAHLSDLRDALHAELETLRAQQAAATLAELAAAAPVEIPKLEALAGELGAKAGDAERIINSAEKQLEHWTLELSKALRADDNDGARKAQAEISLHSARAQNARATLESIEGERQAIEGEIVRLRAAQALENELREYATHAAHLGAHQQAAGLADRLFRIGTSSARDAAADAARELAAIGARIHGLGQQAGLDSALLLETGLDQGPGADAVREVLRTVYGIVESPATAKIFETL